MNASISTISVVPCTVIEQEAEMRELTLLIVVGKMVAVLIVEYFTKTMAGGHIFNRMLNIHKIGISHVAFTREITWTFLWSGDTVLVKGMDSNFRYCMTMTRYL